MKPNEMVNSLKNIFSSNSYFFSIPLIVCVVDLLTILEPAVANKYNKLIVYTFKYNIHCSEA